MVDSRRTALSEMAVADEATRAMTFYHGCSTETVGEAIRQQGIQPGNTGTSARGHTQPVAGRTYLTTNLAYGIIYAIGGNLLGCSESDVDYLIRKKGRGAGRHGYLFVIPGTTVVDDVIADEDSIGEAVHHCDIINNKPEMSVYFQSLPLFRAVSEATPSWRTGFLVLARQTMTAKQLSGSLEGLISQQASGGKRMQKVMSPEQHLRLIQMGAHVAYRGAIMPSETWRIDKTLTPKLKKDGSNFFELAERLS